MPLSKIFIYVIMDHVCHRNHGDIIFACEWAYTFTNRPLHGTFDLRAGRDLYRATPAVTRGLGFCGLVH